MYYSIKHSYDGILRMINYYKYSTEMRKIHLRIKARTDAFNCVAHSHSTHIEYLSKRY